MALDIAAVQAALAEDGLDGWLLYDFHGSNPIARSLAGLNGGGKMTTRRWYYLVPRVGSPRALVHAIERDTLGASSRRTTDRCTRAATRSSAGPGAAASRASGRVAMEYSPEVRHPGHLAQGRRGHRWSLVRQTVAWRWSRPATWCSGSARCGTRPRSASHQERVGRRCYRVKDRAFAAIAGRVSPQKHADQRARDSAADGAAGSRRKGS